MHNRDREGQGRPPPYASAAGRGDAAGQGDAEGRDGMQPLVALPVCRAGCPCGKRETGLSPGWFWPWQRPAAGILARRRQRRQIPGASLPPRDVHPSGLLRHLSAAGWEARHYILGTWSRLAESPKPKARGSGEGKILINQRHLLHICG